MVGVGVVGSDSSSQAPGVPSHGLKDQRAAMCSRSGTLCYGLWWRQPGRVVCRRSSCIFCFSSADDAVDQEVALLSCARQGHRWSGSHFSVRSPYQDKNMACALLTVMYCSVRMPYRHDCTSQHMCSLAGEVQRC